MDISARVAEFARRHIAGRDDLYTSEDFPFDLWAEIGRAGLLGFGLPREFGGRGLGLADMMAAGEVLVCGGRNLGIATSVMSHNMFARFMILGFGDPTQQARYLPEMATGRLIAAVAISELGAGAHPKHLKTRAERRGDGFVINGEKAYVTNGPIAGLYVVLAITAEEAGRKRYTALLVPRETPGLSQTDAGALDFLRPSPHCGLRFEDCAVPADNVLGLEGGAFETMAGPLREFEDMIGLGTRVGGMRVQLDLLAALVHAREIDIDDETAEALGGLRARVDGLRALGRETLAAYEAERAREVTPLLLAARGLSQDFQSDFATLSQALGLAGTDTGLDRFTRDMVKLGGVARYVDRIKARRLARQLLSDTAST